ncbi:SDR family oxidoreductase [bacterium]|nr:SDR family oxidoreductase [bacterium]
MTSHPLAGQWALVLGASSGFGAASALALARRSCHIAGVHLDRRATLPKVQEIIGAIEATGVRALFFNVNASSQEKRDEVIQQLQAVGVGRLQVLLHSLAFGSLLPYFPAAVAGGEPPPTMGRDRMEMTLDVMAHSLVYWTQDLLAAGLLGAGSRIFSMTSSGGSRVMPSYGAVSAAKAALESHTRQMAMELAPRGITVNALRAGVTDTPALRMIPGNERILAMARERNPSGRLTLPEDVAGALVALCGPGTDWITGNVIGVDGGEDIVG